MVATPKLLTSECSAHYPRLWGLIETLSETRTVRRYPIMLDMITFTQEFETWVITVTDHIGMTVKKTPPSRRTSWSHYGADPLVAELLDFFGNNIGAFMLANEELAKVMLYDLADWHYAILMRTNGETVPKYMTTIKCPECHQNSVMKHGKDYWCANSDCCHSWQKTP